MYLPLVGEMCAHSEELRMTREPSFWAYNEDRLPKLLVSTTMAVRGEGSEGKEGEWWRGVWGGWKAMEARSSHCCNRKAWPVARFYALRNLIVWNNPGLLACGYIPYKLSSLARKRSYYTKLLFSSYKIIPGNHDEMKRKEISIWIYNENL